VEKCLRCGYILKSDESLKNGIGGFCRHRNSASKSKWQNRVKRTCDFKDEKPVSLDGDKTHWIKTDGFWVNNKSGSKINDVGFEKLLLNTHLILRNGEVDEDLLSSVKDNLDGFFNNGLDKNDNVV